MTGGEKNQGGRPIKGEAPADSFLHMRVTRAEKGAWVRAARPGKLSEWVRRTLDAAAARAVRD